MIDTIWVFFDWLIMENMSLSLLSGPQIKKKIAKSNDSFTCREMTPYPLKDFMMIGALVLGQFPPNISLIDILQLWYPDLVIFLAEATAIGTGLICK